MKRSVVVFVLLVGVVCAGDKSKPKVCIRLDDSIEKMMAPSAFVNFEDALLLPLERHGVDASVCPVEPQPMEVHYSVRLDHMPEKMVYRTTNVPGGSVTTPVQMQGFELSEWTLIFSGRGMVENKSWNGLNVDMVGEEMAKWVGKHAKKGK